MRLPLIVLALCAGLGPFAAHSIVALLPMLQQAFDVSYGEVQLTIAAYLKRVALNRAHIRQP
jgi:predicted MFS family arabinose efflux permease